MKPFEKAIQHSYPIFFSLPSIHSFIFKMVAYKSAFVIVLTELIDSDDKKPCRGKIDQEN